MTHDSHRTLGVLLTLEDDALFAESSATEGGLRSLPFVPGASLWGAVAARLYAAFKARGLHGAAFHEDRLRFLDGLPVTRTARPALPAPAVWKRKKAGILAESAPADARDAASPADEVLLNTDERALLNLVAHGPDPGVQRKSLRGEYVSADGRLVRPATVVMLKTAMTPGTERIRSGQLFAYESLRPGQTFYAEVHADPDLDADIWSAVTSLLANTTLRLGRSRSAQYGRVRCRTVHTTLESWGWPMANASAALDGGRHRVSFWCVSDLALLDEWGQPSALPTPASVGLDATWQYNPASSAIEVRRYSPFNAYRRSHDTERLVICRGSVLSFDSLHGQPALDNRALTQLRGRLREGVGLYRANGLGQLLVQPAWAGQAVVSFPSPDRASSISVPAPPAAVELSRAEKQFLDWVAQRAEGGSAADDRASQIAQNIASELREVIRQAALLAAGNMTAVTPTKSQWGQLVEAGKNGRNLDDLLKALAAGPLEGATVPGAAAGAGGAYSKARDRNRVWFQASFTGGGRPTTLGDHLLSSLHAQLSAQPTIQCGAVLAKLAGTMREPVGTRRIAPLKVSA